MVFVPVARDKAALVRASVCAHAAGRQPLRGAALQAYITSTRALFALR
jgi:hypothetical protein